MMVRLPGSEKPVIQKDGRAREKDRSEKGLKVSVKEGNLYTTTIRKENRYKHTH